MKYETVIKTQPGGSLPPWAPGYDRLNWYSPYPGMRELLEQNVAEGSLSRYVEFDDHSETTPEFGITYTNFNTLAAAEQLCDLFLQSTICISAEIRERTDI